MMDDADRNDALGGVWPVRRRVGEGLADHFEAVGRDRNLARDMAYAFCDYILGWRTLEGCARIMVDGGIGEDEARSIAYRFRDAKRRVG